ncbi:MAG TPA: asparagine synthase (glutamine-hydrolyzing), partial [Gaiellaceae bacterium]|nr:asparagine synthase (glutamine-hydrolyzing) [Gaiellaceae bacterium]
AGTFGFRPEAAHDLISKMCVNMTPRGPDDSGVQTFVSDDACVGLGSRRLAIIDPSLAGHQPMIDEDRGLALVFNGMIYNFAELREHLLARGETFKSQCDTEVVLRAYGYYGRDCLQHLRGMYAFAIWDRRVRQVFVARDRLGIKPLYIFQAGGRVAFASQVKALLATAAVPFKLSPDAVESYLASAAVDEPLTIIDGVQALPAGHHATITAAGMTVERWWDFPASPDATVDRPAAVERLRELLRESVSLHLVSDAPIGVFLSGGLDSSLIASLAVERNAHVRTLSVTFGETEYSEQPFVDAVVKRLGTDHVDVRLSVDDLLMWSHDAFEAMDQPSYDGINVFAVSRAAAASGLKVALSGLGADELFNGYGFADRVVQFERLRRMPHLARAVFGAALAGLPGSRAVKPAAWLRGDLPSAAAYELLRRAFLPREIRQLMPGHDGRNLAGKPDEVRGGPNMTLELAVAELSSYMRNVLLRDTDAMSMSQSLEVRVPFLDDSVVDWSLRLPTATRGQAPKSLLLEAAHDLVPPEVITRRKQGFVLPLDRWMRRDLHARMDDLFRSPPAVLHGLLDVRAVLDVWQRYLRGAAPPLVSSHEWLRPWSLYVLYEWTANAAAGVPRPAATR